MVSMCAVHEGKRPVPLRVDRAEDDRFFFGTPCLGRALVEKQRLMITSLSSP